MIYWDDSYRIGIEDIDEQHKKIVDTLNRITTFVDNNNYEGAPEVLNEVVTTLFHHLAFEEQILLQNFDFHSHIAEHSSVKLKLIDCVLSKKPIKQRCKETQDILCEWFVHHILYVDRRDLTRLVNLGLQVAA